MIQQLVQFDAYFVTTNTNKWNSNAIVNSDFTARDESSKEHEIANENKSQSNQSMMKMKTMRMTTWMKMTQKLNTKRIK